MKKLTHRHPTRVRRGEEGWSNTVMPLQVARVSSACETGEGQPVSHVQFTSKKLAEKSSEHPFCQVKTPPELRIPSLFWCVGEWNERVGPVELNAIELTISLGPEATKKLHHSFCSNPCAEWKNSDGCVRRWFKVHAYYNSH